MPPANSDARRIHRRVFGSSPSRTASQPMGAISPRDDPYYPYTTYEVPVGPEAAAPTSASPPPAQAFSDSTTQYTNTVPQSAPEVISLAATGTATPHQGTPENVKSAAIVAVVLIGVLLLIVFGGELLRRRHKDTPVTTKGGSDALRTYLCRRTRQHKARPSPGATGVAIHNPEIPSKSPRKILENERPFIAERTRRTGIAALWPFKLFFSTSSISLVPGSSLAPPPPQTTWSEFPLPAITLKPFLERIPEDHEDDARSQSSSDIALTLGLAIQRSLESSSMVSSVDPGSDLPKSFLSMRSDRDSIFKCDSGENDEEDSTTECGTGEGISTTMNGSSRSSLTTLESADLDCEGEVKEEVFELRRAQTRSMQMNKAVLLSLGVIFKDAEAESSEPPQSTADDEASSQFAEMASLAALAGSYSASTVNLDDFPAPPSVLPRFPSFV
ncbi:hypothetical protein BV22DRAFT_1194145 [Leucogyrophana mollusca]|uniref:Uncharacterized protein n=1 Tax=Leucogyrophana mollusca TaxID=85980 RepID=A0ACB8BLG6_9AGAM|nr:hypothetical protein BV22DRAFT_1194145 [Leucogyrophana mollusca]